MSVGSWTRARRHPIHQDRKWRHARRGSVPTAKGVLGGEGEEEGRSPPSAGPRHLPCPQRIGKRCPAAYKGDVVSSARHGPFSLPPDGVGSTPSLPSPGGKFTIELTSKVKSHVHVRVDVRWRLPHRTTSFVALTRFCSGKDASFRDPK